MLRFLRLILWPFSLVYGIIISARNFMYDRGILKTTKFSLPVIVVGNLAVGGTGKSPMTELLIRLLKNDFKLATLSRGYGRKSSGFLYVSPTDSVRQVGDEPLQFKNKFPEITVAVCEDRVVGVEKLQRDHELVLLDDAYQHRALTPGLSILLIEYQSLFKAKLLLPAGNFRDSYSQRKRADMIVISKSPEQLTADKKKQALERLDADPAQNVFFSYLSYDHPQVVFTNKIAEIPITKSDHILLVSGIANPALLQKYLQGQCASLKTLSYPDHHLFSENDLRDVIELYQQIQSDQKYIVTTEKDYQRLKDFAQVFDRLPPSAVRVLPVKTSFHDAGDEGFSSIVHQYCKGKIS